MVLAAVMYPNDNNGKYISDLLVGGTTADTGAVMVNLLDYYSRATNLFLCPTCSQPQTSTANNTIGGDVVTPFATREPRNTGLFYQGSYGYNGWLYSDKDANGKHYGNGAGATLPNGGSGNGAYFEKESAVTHSTETPMMYDQAWTDAWPMETDAPYHDLYNSGAGGVVPGQLGGGGNQMGRITLARHGAGGGVKAPKNYNGRASQLPAAINMGFCDGHAETTKLKSLWTFYWHSQWTPSLVVDSNAN
jgi:prepilin-type processing-associated H-X9-DG protein